MPLTIPANKLRIQGLVDLPIPHTLKIRASIVENLLPIVSANITLYGLDASADDPYDLLAQAELLWDTGAHSTGHRDIHQILINDGYSKYKFLHFIFDGLSQKRFDTYLLVQDMLYSLIVAEL